MTVDVDATLQVETAPGVLAPLKVSDDAASPTAKALPVLDAEARSKLDAIVAEVGGLAESAPGTDTASSGLNGRLQRVAQRLTTLLGLLPGSLGQKARAASLAVTLSSEDMTSLVQRALAVELDSVRQTTRVMTPLSVEKTGPLTDDVLVAVAPGQRIRLLKNAGHCDPATAAGVYPVVTVKIGATTVYADKLEAGLPWAELVCLEGGDGEDLTLTLTTTETVFLNMRYEVFSA